MGVMKIGFLAALIFNGPAWAFDFEKTLTLWLDDINAEILETGIPLSPELRDVANQLGIRHPDRIRILVVDEVPAPSDHPILYREGERRNLWGPGIQGNAQVFGHGIAVTRQVLDDTGKMAHELMHVAQIERFASLQDFVVEYLRQIAEHGYADAPLEVEAFKQNSRYTDGE